MILNDTAVHDLVVCPPGVTYIVKDVHAIVTAGTAGTVSVWVVTTAGVLAYFLRESLNSLAATERTTWTVMRPGDIIRVNTGSAPTHILVSGTRLDGVAVIP
jgi:hypothetical protein